MVLYFVIPFGNISAWLPCHRKDTNQGYESMTDGSVFNNIIIDIYDIHDFHICNTFLSVLSNLLIACLSKTQDRSQRVVSKQNIGWFQCYTSCWGAESPTKSNFHDPDKVISLGK